MIKLTTNRIKMTTTTPKTFDNLPQFGGCSFDKSSYGECWHWSRTSRHGVSCEKDEDGYGIVFSDDCDYFRGTEEQCYDWIVDNMNEDGISDERRWYSPITDE